MSRTETVVYKNAEVVIQDFKFSSCNFCKEEFNEAESQGRLERALKSVRGY